MHIDQLTYFVHVVETGSINATAQKYFMTQQAINSSLKKLESEGVVFSEIFPLPGN